MAPTALNAQHELQSCSFTDVTLDGSLLQSIHVSLLFLHGSVIGHIFHVLFHLFLILTSISVISPKYLFSYSPPVKSVIAFSFILKLDFPVSNFALCSSIRFL